MADITMLKQQLKQLKPLMKDRAAANARYELYADKLAPIQERLNKIRGLGRLKKPFIRFVKVRPLKRKQRKAIKRLAAKDLKIEKTLGGIYANLGRELTGDSKIEAGFNYLQGAFDAVKSTKSVIQRSAKKCKRAGRVENIVGCTEEKDFTSNGLNIPGLIWNAATGLVAHFNAKSAGKSITTAQRALRSLRNEVKDAPQLNAMGEDYITSRSHWALLDDIVLGGGRFLSWGSWGNWSLARDFKQTKNQLLDVSDKLDLSADRIINDQISLLAEVGAQARETSPYIGQLLSSLETYLPAKAKLNNAAKPT